MRPNVVINVQESADVGEKTQLWIEEYEKISSMQVEKQEICRKLTERVKKAAELCVSGKGDINEPIFDGEFPLGDEKDAMFAAKFFTVVQMALMQTGLADKVPRGYYVEPAYDVLIRNGFLAELEGDYQSAFNYYDGVPLPDYALKERMDLCRQRMKRCVSHPDKSAVDVCTSCGRPICKECKDTQQIYSRSDEMGLPYCKECYNASVRYLNKHGH